VTAEEEVAEAEEEDRTPKGSANMTFRERQRTEAHINPGGCHEHHAHSRFCWNTAAMQCMDG
jgi:hypothetical protein